MRQEAERCAPNMQQHGRLEAGNEPLVRIRRRIGEGVDGLGVPDDAAM